MPHRPDDFAFASASRSIARAVLPVALVLAGARAASAGEKNWNSTGTSWTTNTGGNWSPTGIPTASDWINFRSTDPTPGTGMTISFSTVSALAVQTINWGLTSNDYVGAANSTAGPLQLEGPSGSNPFTSLISVAGTGNFAVAPGSGSGTGGTAALQLDASGAFTTANTGGLVISANIIQGNSTARNLTFAGTSTAATGKVSASNYGAYNGTYNGAIVLTGSNSFAGTTTVSSGYLSIGGVNALAGTSSVTVSAGGQLQLGITAGGSYTLGSGTLSLSGAGPVTADSAGALIVGNNVTDGTTHTLTNAISLDADATINARGSTNVLVLSGPISGAGGLIKQGGGQLRIGNASNSYAGATTVNNGTLQLISGDNRLPTGTTVNLGQSAKTNVGTLDLNGFSQRVAGLNSVTGTNASATTFNTVTSATAATLTLGGSGTYAYSDGTATNSGVITGAIAVSKIGSGTQSFGGSNTYSGGTTITGGTLLAANSTAGGSATGSGQVTIGQDTIAGTQGVLAGTGAVTGTITVNSGGTITAGSGARRLSVTGSSAGDTVGTLTTGGQVWNAGGTQVVKFASGTSYDQINMGLLNLSNLTSGKFNLVLTYAANATALGSPAPGQQFKIGYASRVTTDGTNSLNNADLSAYFSLNTDDLNLPSNSFTIQSVADGGGQDIVLQAAPEPTTAVLFGLGGSVLLGRRRARRRSDRGLSA